MDQQPEHATDLKPSYVPPIPQQNRSSPVGSVKPPVVRGARACTVCRAAKMKCVGAEDGQKPCQRCKRANVECKFEKHRRGRKPGSKNSTLPSNARLSEASKMLRRLEKGLNTAKMKSQSAEASMPASYSSDRNGHQELKYGTHHEAAYTTSGASFASNGLTSIASMPTYQNGMTFDGSSNTARSLDIDDEDEDPDKNEQPLFPATMINKENQRNSFFRTILNPEDTPLAHDIPPRKGSSNANTQIRIAPLPSGLNDPVTAGIVSEKDAHVLFDLVFLRLNPFINLFDPTLHTVAYVRSKCPFLFTTLVMAGCKFFRHEDFRACQKLANEFAVRAFAEGWKRVEVVQAFACLTYWRDYDDKRTWMYIGYACRMGVELGLNRYTVNPPVHESEFQKLERRNRERTYLVLFIHDRSLSTQTGRHWMLPEDDLIRNANSWHKQGGPARPEDVIVAGFVELRRIAAETTDVFNSSKSSGASSHTDVNYEVLLRNCNAKLTQWADGWQREMDIAGGEKFHSSFLSFFRLYVRLFLNSFGIQSAMSPGTRQSPSVQALSTCCTSAIDSLRIVSKDFANMSMLRYGQDSVMVMSAYSAIFLLRLLRNPITYSHLSETTAHEIYDLIGQTADAFHDASSPASTSAAYHSRFLRSLVTEEIMRSRQTEKRKDTNMPIDPRLQGLPPSHASTQMYVQHASDHSYSFGASSPTSINTHSNAQQSMYSPDLPSRSRPVATTSNGSNVSANYHPGYLPAAPHHASAEDAHYWRSMFLELGYGNGEPNLPHDRIVTYPVDDGQHPHQIQQHHSQIQYHQMSNYGH